MVEICHVLHVVDLPDGTAMAFGAIMEVPESEVAAHLAHGDSTVADIPDLYYFEEHPGVREFFEDIYGIDLSNAQCYFYF
jgi:hypothetical protein